MTMINKTAMDLPRLVKLENLAGRETVKQIMEQMSRQSGQLGKHLIQHAPKTLRITPQGIERISLTAPTRPYAMGQQQALTDVGLKQAGFIRYAPTHILDALKSLRPKALLNPSERAARAIGEEALSPLAQGPFKAFAHLQETGRLPAGWRMARDGVTPVLA